MATYAKIKTNGGGYTFRKAIKDKEVIAEVINPRLYAVKKEELLKVLDDEHLIHTEAINASSVWHFEGSDVEVVEGYFDEDNN